MSYTKGPWAVVAKPSGIIFEIGPLRADEYAGASWLDVAPEDAALMADAPALLEALQTLLIAMEDLQFDYNTNSGSEAMSQARALIAKHGGAV